MGVTAQRLLVLIVIAAVSATGCRRTDSGGRAAREVTIYANAVMGDVKIIVNAHTRVVVEGFAVMADFSEARDKVAPELGPDSPVVRVKGFALMASVSVQRKPMPGSTTRRLGWKA